jgi:hypothetical protein
VVINTGNGLKDVAGAMKGVELVNTHPMHVEPDIQALKRTYWKPDKNGFAQVH